MRSKQFRWSRTGPPARIMGVGIGGCAILAMATLALQTESASAGGTNLQSAGSMTTGATSTVSIATASTAAANLATPAASPTVKATPEWGQPSEP